MVKDAPLKKGVVVYWMSREQRARDNWAFVYAQEVALEQQCPLMVVFCLVDDFLGATMRQYGFMLKGLEKVDQDLREKQIPFCLITGDPEKEIPKFLQRNKAGALVTDFDPLRIKRRWKRSVARDINIPFYEIDAHNIVPCWEASGKQEFGAYTIRPKINRLIPEYVKSIPGLKRHPFGIKKYCRNDFQKIAKRLTIARDVTEVPWLKPGENEARKVLKNFISRKLCDYGTQRNDPTLDGQSHISPYLHFGQISAQKVALEVIRSHASQPVKDAFLEELIVRRELSDNFCLYNKNYDNPEGFPDWAQKTLKVHARDKRAYTYTLKQCERAQTHDDLWNAAQTEMVATGKMHGYMRMYWAKKILEWSKTPAEAMKIAIYLNDTYELDGRDPNGYAGIAWSMGGVHDRAWGERPIFGKIRYMSYNGCRSKFDVAKYIRVKGK